MVEIDCKIIGLFEVTKKDKEIEIMTFEIIEKEKEFDTLFIKELTQDFPEDTWVCLYISSGRSKAFWGKCGFILALQPNGTEIHYYKGRS